MIGSCASLLQCLHVFSKDKNISHLAREFDSLIKKSAEPDLIISFYHKAIEQIEDKVWEQDPLNHIDLLQSVFREMESWYEKISNDSRHNIYLFIPIADRPQQLLSCLKSVQKLCETYCYGGKCGHVYKKIHIIIADDSGSIESQKKIQEVLCDPLLQALQLDYFSQKQQFDLVEKVNHSGVFNSVLPENISSNFSLKGASFTRNVCYLKIIELEKQSKTKNLYYFIDSDQEFVINQYDRNADSEFFGINYFYALDRLFFENDIQVLTGKVVGDPPVSPAVMAENFLSDIVDFLDAIEHCDLGGKCDFHPQDYFVEEGGYHDMASLFGFDQKNSNKMPNQYCCNLKGHHTNYDCLEFFSQTLNHFFDGEHPTKKSYYQYQSLKKTVVPARTIYTGNYVFNKEGIKYFIPFASLKLRMAGPVMGRVIKSEISQKFVSANLPMLHRRVMKGLEVAEYRSGVQHHECHADISLEFIRQFYGDVLLFSIEKILSTNIPLDLKYHAQIEEIILSIMNDILVCYVERKERISRKVELIKARLLQAAWWNGDKARAICHNFEVFLESIRMNFSKESSVYKLLEDEKKQKEYIKEIIGAVVSFNSDQQLWEEVIRN